MSTPRRVTVQESAAAVEYGTRIGRVALMVTTILALVGFVALSIAVMLATAVAVFSPQLNESKELVPSGEIARGTWHRVA